MGRKGLAGGKYLLKGGGRHKRCKTNPVKLDRRRRKRRQKCFGKSNPGKAKHQPKEKKPRRGDRRLTNWERVELLITQTHRPRTAWETSGDETGKGEAVERRGGTVP